MSEFIEIKLQKRNETIKMQKGCSFENNGAIYRVNNNGELSIFNKSEKTWSTGSEIKINNYQLQTFMAIADNHEEKENGQTIEGIVLSKKDIEKAIEQHKNSQVTDDLGKYLGGNYTIYDAQRYTDATAIAAYVSNGDESTSGNLVFKFGSEKNAVELSEYIANVRSLVKNVIGLFTAPKATTKTDTNAEIETKKVKTTTVDNASTQKASNSKKPFFDRSKTTELPEAYQLGLQRVAKKMKISQYQLNLHIAKTAKETGYSEYFIKHLVAMEDYEPKVRDTKDSTITGGFGHSALKDKSLKDGQEVTPDQAFKWLAQDIKYFESKVKAMKLSPNDKETIGDNFNKLPLSIKEAIIDVAFNRDARKIEEAEEYRSLRANIKGGYENLPATAARLCQDFSRYSYNEKKKHNHTTGLMYRNTYRFLLAIRDLDDNYRKIAKRRFENIDDYFNTTVALKRAKGHHSDVKMLKTTWNKF